MTICITSTGQSLDAPINPSFGRAPYFLFVDPEIETPQAVKNTPSKFSTGITGFHKEAGKHILLHSKHHSL